MIVSLLRFCIYNVSRKYSESVDFLNVVKFISGETLVTLHDRSQKPMTFCLFVTFHDVYMSIFIFQSLWEPCI